MCTASCIVRCRGGGSRDFDSSTVFYSVMFRCDVVLLYYTYKNCIFQIRGLAWGRSLRELVGANVCQCVSIESSLRQFVRKTSVAGEG